jgi:2,3-dihydroxybiphenyl 1,2-dioxygenase
MPLRGLGYLGLATPDLAAWPRFATELLGLAASPGSQPDGSLRFRMDARIWRIALHRAARGGLAYLGWEVAERGDIASAAERLSAAGVAVEAPNAAARAERGVGDLLRFRDPFGHTHELFSGAEHDLDRDFVSPAGVSGFVTKHGMGHVLLTVPDCAQAEDFYTRALGLRVTDRMNMGGGKRAVFLRASPRHHSLAVTDLLPEPGLHHFMIETARLEDVGRGWDRAQASDVKVQVTLGQHSNDPMVSFYVEAPGGFGVELGWNGMLIDDSSWCVREFSGLGDLWGHRGVAMEEIHSARTRAAGMR